MHEYLQKRAHQKQYTNIISRTLAHGVIFACLLETNGSRRLTSSSRYKGSCVGSCLTYCTVLLSLRFRESTLEFALVIMQCNASVSPHVPQGKFETKKAGDLGARLVRCRESLASYGARAPPFEYTSTCAFPYLPYMGG
jgi:hypothetical protein